MKQFLSLILAVVLVLAVGGSLASGTMAGFFDVEHSIENRMHAGYQNLTVDGQDDEQDDIIESFQSGPMWPDQPYERVVVLCNTGTLGGIAYIHIFDVLGVEDAPGVGIGTSEPELAAEEGTSPIGEDENGNPVYATYDSTSPASGSNPPLIGADYSNLHDHVLVTMWWDADDSCSFEDGERIELNSGEYTLPLSQIDCTEYLLGELAADPPFPQGGGWGSYFQYDTADGTLVKPLIAGKIFTIGTVTVSYDGANLHVLFETDGGWTMTSTKVYADTVPPTSGAPGQFPYKHEGLPYFTTDDEHTIPIGPGTLYIAAHADVWDADGNDETAWAKGKCRKLKLRFLFPDIPEENLDLHLFPGADSKWNCWPTNAYQGDYCTFNIRYTLE